MGDSHAAQWFPAVRAIAKERGWDLTVYYKGGCPYNAATAAWTSTPEGISCGKWNSSVRAALHDHPPALVITSAVLTYDYPGAGGSATVGEAGFVTSWSDMEKAGMPIVVLADSPHLTSAELDSRGRDRAGVGLVRRAPGGGA